MMTMVVLVKSFYKDNHWLTRFNDYDNGGFNEKFLQRQTGLMMMAMAVSKKGFYKDNQV